MSRIVPSDPVKALAGKRNARVALICTAAFFGMVGAAYASVPLYRAFCQLTGWDGTVKRGETAPTSGALARTITVRFDTNVRDLPWTFRSEQVTQDVHIGAPGLAYFRVRNDSDQPITGRATYNVTPDVAGAYFVKTQCFCFDDQTIPARTEMRFPVIYYVQPEFAQDRNTRQFQEVVLSYTFFRTTKPEPAKAAAAGVPDPAKAG